MKKRGRLKCDSFNNKKSRFWPSLFSEDEKKLWSVCDKCKLSKSSAFKIFFSMNFCVSVPSKTVLSRNSFTMTIFDDVEVIIIKSLQLQTLKKKLGLMESAILMVLIVWLQDTKMTWNGKVKIDSYWYSVSHCILRIYFHTFTYSFRNFFKVQKSPLFFFDTSFGIIPSVLLNIIILSIDQQILWKINLKDCS